MTVTSLLIFNKLVTVITVYTIKLKIHEYNLLNQVFKINT